MNTFKRAKILLTTALLFLLTGCLQSTQHRETINSVLNTAESKGLSAAINDMEINRKILLKPDKEGEEWKINPAASIIDLLEIGALYHYNGQYKKSNDALSIVAKHYGIQEDRAKISLTKTADLAIRTTISEGLSGRYELSNYEKVFLHTLKELNYLMLGDIESAVIEGLATEELHAWIEDQEDQEVQEEKQKAQEEQKRKDSDEAPPKANYSKNVEKLMGKSVLAIGEALTLTSDELSAVENVSHGYRNAMTYNLFSLGLEMRNTSGDFDNAIISLRKSLELYENGGVGDRFVRLANSRGLLNQGRNRAITRGLSRKYPRLVSRAKRSAEVRPNFHVFLHTGESPKITSNDIHIPNPISKSVTKLSIPKYEIQPDDSYILTLDKEAKDRSGSLLDFDKLALKSYADKLPGLRSRMITRFITHTLIDRNINQKLGVLGSVVTSLKNDAIEKADTRSWTTLPKVIHYGQTHVSNASGQVQVKTSRGRVIFKRKFPVKSGYITLVNIRKIGDKFIAKHIYLKDTQGRSNKRNFVDNRQRIRIAQQQLNDLGFMTGTPDGVAGSKTKIALKEFLASRNLPGKPVMSDDNIRTVKQAYREMIKKIQSLLTSVGYNVGRPDGLAGEKTRAAIKDYQIMSGLEANGRATELLLRKMQQ